MRIIIFICLCYAGIMVADVMFMKDEISHIVLGLCMASHTVNFIVPLLCYRKDRQFGYLRYIIHKSFMNRKYGVSTYQFMVFPLISWMLILGMFLIVVSSIAVLSSSHELDPNIIAIEIAAMMWPVFDLSVYQGYPDDIRSEYVFKLRQEILESPKVSRFLNIISQPEVGSYQQA